MLSRIVLAVWTLLACAVQGLMADSDTKYNRDVIIGASVAITLVIVIIIICIGCFCYSKAVKKIKTKMRMRELIRCKYRSKMIISPEPLATLDHYFMKEGIDVDSLFTVAVESNEDMRQDGEKEEVFNEDVMYMGDIMHAPNKVKQLYLEQDMVTPDTISQDTGLDESKNKRDEGKEETKAVSDDTKGICEQIEKERNSNTSTELKFKDEVDDTLFIEKLVVTESNNHVEEFINKRDETDKRECSDRINSKEQGEVMDESVIKEIDDDDDLCRIEDISSIEEIDFRDNSRNPSPMSNEPYRRKTPFLSSPEISQFFDFTNTVKKSKKNKNRQNSFKKSSKKAHKIPRTSSRLNYPLAIANVNRILTGKNKPKSDIAKELKLFSSQVLVSHRLRRQNLLYSRISLPHKYQPDKDVHITKKVNKKKVPNSQKSPTAGSRNRNPSRVSGYRSQGHISVSDIGIGLR